MKTVTLDTSGTDITENMLRITIAMAKWGQRGALFRHSLDSKRVDMPTELFYELLEISHLAKDTIKKASSCPLKRKSRKPHLR